MRTRFHSVFAVYSLLLLLLASCNAADSDASASTRGRVQPSASMHDARASHTATLLRDGRVLITGGMVENGVFLSSAELYDPKTARFESLPPMKEARTSHTAALLPDGRVVIAGGISGREFVDGNWRGISATTIEIYDPVQRRFTTSGRLQVPGTSHAAITLADGRVVFLGGYRDRTPVDSVEIFDPRTGRTEAAGNLASPREGCGCVLLDNGKILLTGGSREDRELNGTYELYDPASRTSRVLGPMQTPRRKHAAQLLDDGRVLIVGGSNTSDWTGQYASAELFDPKTGRSVKVGDMAQQRFKIRQAVVRLRDGSVLVAGGKADAEIFDPDQKRFLSVAGTMGAPHYFSTATLLSDGRVLLAGGYGNGGAGRGPLSTKETWLYVPNSNATSAALH